MTNAEKFTEIFGHDLRREYATKTWWEQEFIHPEQKPETVTEFADRCRECGARYGKMLEQTSWIPCSERLPEIHQDVILSLRSLDVEVGFRAETEPYFYCDGSFIESQNVLAWMPLPEPYK